jgi:hypothetical protein
VRRRTLGPLLALLLSTAPAAATAQERPRTWESVGGAALGAASGAVLGSLAALVPCNDTYAGPHCVRWAATASAVLGGVAGTFLGGADSDALERVARGAAIGFGIGAVAGAALTPFIQRWAPEDAFALGLVGGAVGTAPVGAAIGFGAGVAVGAMLWRATPRFGSPGASALALSGLAAGVLAEWIVRAAAAGGDPPSLGVHVRF